MFWLYEAIGYSTGCLPHHLGLRPIGMCSLHLSPNHPARELEHLVRDAEAFGNGFGAVDVGHGVVHDFDVAGVKFHGVALMTVRF